MTVPVPTTQLRRLLGLAAVLHAGHWLLLRADAADRSAAWLVVLLAAVLIQALWVAGLVVLTRPLAASPAQLGGNIAALAAHHLLPPHGRSPADWLWFVATGLGLGAALASMVAVGL